ncbi:hypothetical protein GGR51DRAFT_521572 [Nemania sp. FL0031]|nr:hypothetical protein GGR51DRAFT_521572 [Nemania sp. FL0031]
MPTYKKTESPRVVTGDLVDAQDQKTQTMDLNLIAAKRTWNVVRDILRILVTLPDPHLTDEDLKRLNIKCTGLDLSTGKPTDGSEMFIRPLSTTRIHEALQRTKPWVDNPLYSGRWSSPISNATDVLGCLIRYLHHGEADRLDLMSETDWNTRHMEYSEGEQLFRSGKFRNIYGHHAEWAVETVLDKMDDSTPHVSCLLADNALLSDDQLSNAEIWCILAITNRRLRLPEYHSHRIIPVTVISTSDRKLRIVQGYVDGREGCLRARKSPILDLENEDIQLIALVLSWCIGETVGDTKN